MEILYYICVTDNILKPSHCVLGSQKRRHILLRASSPSYASRSSGQEIHRRCRALAHGTKDCKLFSIIWIAGCRCLGPHFGPPSCGAPRCHPRGDMDGIAYHYGPSGLCIWEYAAHHTHLVPATQRTTQVGVK